MANRRKHLNNYNTWLVILILCVAFENIVPYVVGYIPVEYSFSDSGSRANEAELPGIEKVSHHKESTTNFTGSYHGELYTSYSSPTLDRLANEVDLDQMLSYETAWTNGRRVTTFIRLKNGASNNRVSLDSPISHFGHPANKGHQGNNDPHIKVDSYSSYDYNAGSSYLQSSESFKYHYSKYGLRRKRREVYGRDDRFFIPGSTFGQREPFSYSVRVSTGCTGILISPRHVLTAAHCVHDQTDYVDGFRQLKIGFALGKGKLEWFPVRNVRISKGWIEGGREAGPYFDYALLKLRKVHHKPYINLTISKEDRYGTGERIYFTSFEDDKPSNTLWYRSCTIEEQDKNFLYHFCDAQPGSSGSGVYAWTYDQKGKVWKRNVIGVFSGNRWKVYDDWFLRPKRFNVAVRITSSKYVQICKWLGIYGDQECHHPSVNQLFL